MCEKYQTFLVPTGPENHLYIVVTHEDDNGMHILINVSSIDPDIPYDTTCCLEAGVHRFIRHPSYVAYKFAIQRHKNFVDQQVQNGAYRPHDNASGELVTKICEGIKKSNFTKRGIRDDYNAALRAVARRKKAAM